MTPDDERELLLRYRPWLRVTAADLLQGRPPHFIEEVAQEGWIAMWRALHEDRDVTVKAPLDWWLKRQALRRMQNAVRDLFVPVKQRQHVFTDDVPDLVAASAELENIELAYHHGEIRAAVDRLPPREREYVLLRFWGGYTYPQLVTHFGYNTSAVWRVVRPKLVSDLERLADIKG
jgi:RNA polymerase sigma factor (sigma-70 family)